MNDQRPLRVLHLMDHSIPLHSGYSFRSRYIVRVQERLGCRAEVVTSARHDVFDAADEEIDGIRFHRTSVPQGWFDRLQLKVPFWRESVLTRALAERAMDVARRFAPDVLHAHSPLFDGQAALRVGKKLGLPVLYEIRAFWEDDAVDKGKIREGGIVWRQVRRLEREVCLEADRVVCICEGIREDLVARGVPREKILVSKNGVELETFVPREKDPRLLERYGLGDKRVLGFIGSFFVYEGLEDLIEAAARLRAERDDFRLLLIGGGDAEGEVRAAIRRLGVEGLVVLPGRVPHDEVRDCYALVDTFVYPRHSSRLTELTTPLKPLEAMAMERTVVASDVGGLRELLDDVGTGATFRAGDVDDLVRVLRGQLDRPLAELREEGRLARERVGEVRSWDRNLRPVVQAYRELVGRPLSVAGGQRPAPSP